MHTFGSLENMQILHYRKKWSTFKQHGTFYIHKEA
jgi:hypothetical protein